MQIPEDQLPTETKVRSRMNSSPRPLQTSLVLLVLLVLLFAPSRTLFAGRAAGPHFEDALHGLQEKLFFLSGEIRLLQSLKVDAANQTERLKLQFTLDARLRQLDDIYRRLAFENSAEVYRARELVAGIVSAHYPELAQKTFRFHPIHATDTFLTSFFDLKDPYLKRWRDYRLGLNLEAFQREPPVPAKALEAILAHELAHTLYYSKRSFFSLLAVLRIFIFEKQLIRFERRADLQAIARGYGDGLIAYREWLYGQIPPDDAARKRKIYLSPAEISLIDRTRRIYPGIMEVWLAHPPLCMEEILQSIATLERSESDPAQPKGCND